MNTVKVGRRGQIAIPRKIRQALDLQEGDRLAFVQRDGEVLLQPLKHTLRDFRGSIPVTEPQDFTAFRQQVLAAHAYWIGEDDR